MNFANDTSTQTSTTLTVNGTSSNKENALSFTSPLIHADFSHLISNTIPLLVLGWIIFSFYPKVAYLLFLFIYYDW